MCDTPVSEYMFEKLRPEDKLVLTYLFEETAKTICESYPSHSKTKFVYPDVLCWLLHKLDEQERERMFVLHSFPVLLCYLEWPKQESFMEMAKCLLKFLSTKHFGYILKQIAFKMAYFEDFNYRKLFSEFWQQGLEHHKKYAVGASSCWCALYYLFMIGDVQNIRMIFSRANDAQKRRFSKSRWGSQILEYLQYMGEKDLCNCFIKNCLPAKNISHSQ
ncbi:uncharacterized protein TNIN_172601 [Trichonephila inaurata madagascariensis]|uniref:Uncharacterized protein n=1 Tax=Trichonephila inaurata madagascariensis TaxID=2747483 RepID=A0A8X6WV07_9ARAC|nr:uncharacterized protein TNIN_172601 [Trichonephila inaurata madagascariensis]